MKWLTFAMFYVVWQFICKYSKVQRFNKFWFIHLIFVTDISALLSKANIRRNVYNYIFVITQTTYLVLHYSSDVIFSFHHISNINRQPFKEKVHRGVLTSHTALITITLRIFVNSAEQNGAEVLLWVRSCLLKESSQHLVITRKKSWS